MQRTRAVATHGTVLPDMLLPRNAIAPHATLCMHIAATTQADIHAAFAHAAAAYTTTVHNYYDLT